MRARLSLVGLVFLASACSAVAQPVAQTTAVQSSPPWTRCSRVAMSADAMATVIAGRPVVFTATAFGCSPVDYRFVLVHMDTGDRMTTRDWDLSPTWTWDTTLALPGPYSIVADARPTYEPGDSPDASISYPFSIIAAEPPASSARTSSPSPPPAKGTTCTSVSLELSPTGPITSGTHVTATATPGGCATAEYRFVLVDPNGVGLFMQNWSASNTWTWDSSGADAGQYYIEVDIRAYGVASTNPDATTRVEVDVIHVAPTPS